MSPRTFAKFAGGCAILAGVFGLLYAIAFIVVGAQDEDLGKRLSAFFLMVGSFLSTVALVGLYSRVREAGQDFALWALLIGTIGAIGAAVHGGYDLALALAPSTTAPAGLPSQIDPRGLLTFGATGLALLVFALLIGRTEDLPKGLAYLGCAVAALFLVLYSGRLVIVEATNPIIVIPAVVTGFLANPAWYVWLGVSLWRERRVVSTVSVGV